jgi:capsular polysaccharide transport system permease protein
MADTSTPPPLTPRAHLPRFATARAITALILREMITSYGRSPGGFLWAFLEPTLGLLVMVAVFSAGFRSPPIGSNFAIFFASGLLPFSMFMAVSAKVSQSLNFSRQLLNFPRVTLADTILARLILTVMINLTISCVMFTVILTVFETRTILDLPRITMSYIMAISLGLGIGLMNAVLISRHQIWQSVWSVITRPLVLLSGVLILHTSLPEPYRTWLEWNPLVHVTGEARRGFYYSYHGDYVSPQYVFGISLVTGVIGFLFLRRYYRDFLER